MQVGIILNAGDPGTLAALAAEAETAGWDGVFTFDAIAIGDMELYDPWVVLAAMAMTTRHVRLGMVVAAPARRRPWKLARETMTLDRLSGGRLVLPVGLGATDDAGFGTVGEPTGARVRAELLDETLEILDGLWTGEPFGYEGAHYRFAPMTFRPTPVQRPRIPVWVVGAWPHPRSMRRTLRWDGIVAQSAERDGRDPGDAGWLEEIAGWIGGQQAMDPTLAARHFDVVVDGKTPADDPDRAIAIVRSHAEAGATWWIEADWADPTVETLRRRIAAGPPRP